MGTDSGGRRWKVEGSRGLRRRERLGRICVPGKDREGVYGTRNHRR